jgi:hypothetical protein
MSCTPPKRGHQESGPRDENELARCILDYLRAQPQARDTLEGITKWWLMRQRVSESMGIVQRAVNRLRDRGLICERQLAGGSLLYEAAPQDREIDAGTTNVNKK